MSDTPSAASRALSFMDGRAYTTRRELASVGLSPEQVRRALRVLSPALMEATRSDGAKVYAIRDKPLAIGILARRRMGRPPSLLMDVVALMKTEEWRSTATIAGWLDYPPYAIRRCLERRPDMFSRRKYATRVTWRLRDDFR